MVVSDLAMVVSDIVFLPLPVLGVLADLPQDQHVCTSKLARPSML
jgi:hypothetical protein